MKKEALLTPVFSYSNNIYAKHNPQQRKLLSPMFRELWRAKVQSLQQRSSEKQDALAVPFRATYVRIL